jgi:hypothetical protein
MEVENSVQLLKSSSVVDCAGDAELLPHLTFYKRCNASHGAYSGQEPEPLTCVQVQHTDDERPLAPKCTERSGRMCSSARCSTHRSAPREAGGLSSRDTICPDKQLNIEKYHKLKNQALHIAVFQRTISLSYTLQLTGLAF